MKQLTTLPKNAVLIGEGIYGCQWDDETATYFEHFRCGGVFQLETGDFTSTPCPNCPQED